MSQIRSGFPKVRLRRLRKSEAIRALFQETRLSARDFIVPIFVQEGRHPASEAGSMPDVAPIPAQKLLDEIESIAALGIRGVILFGLPSSKDDMGSSAYAAKGVVQRSAVAIKKHFGGRMVIITDVCLCQYTSHGHCGLVRSGTVDNDASTQALAKVAVSHAESGADIVAPSAMMDGQVKAIREALDGAGFPDVAVMGYSAKQASPLYAPFRDIAHSTPEFGDRKSYQMPFSNSREAMREMDQDAAEAADILMVKPALPYLDIIYKARQRFDLPICAYSVSGEYAMIKAAAQKGWLDEEAVTTELMTSIKRAGADVIITYQAKYMASLLSK